MVNQIDNSFELAEDEKEQEYLRRQRENEEQTAEEATEENAAALLKSFAKDAEFEHDAIKSRVITQHARLEQSLEQLIDSTHRLNDIYLPDYTSSRMRKEILLTYIPWVDEEVPIIGKYIAQRLGCPVVNLDFSESEYGYEFLLNEAHVQNFVRLEWKFVLFAPAMVCDENKADPWLWLTQLRNQLAEAGAEDTSMLALKSLDPRRELIPNSFVLGGMDVDEILSGELYLHGELWAKATGKGRNVAEKMELVIDGGDIPIDITPVSWDEMRFMRAEKMVIESRRFPGKHSHGVPVVSREAGMIADYEVPASVKLKATVAPHGLRKTQNALTDFNLRVNSWGGCAITITPLRSVNKSIEQNFGGQTRGELLDNRTMQSVEKITQEFLCGTPQQRHAILCAESLTHKSKIGLKLSRIKEAWTALNDQLNEERWQKWEADGSKGKKPKRQTLAPTIDIVIDECPIVINRILEGATVRNPGLTIDVFSELLKFAVSTGGRISIMSADLSSKEYHLFSSLLGLKEFDWLNENTVSCINAGVRTALPNKRHIYLSNHLQATKARIYEAVNAARETKQLVFIASNKVKPSSTSTATLAEQIKVHCGEDVRILELNAKTVVNRKHPAYAFMNADEHQQMLLLKEIDVVIATSVVEAGVSWDSRLFTDVPDTLIRNIFCIDVDGRWSSSGILQAINRWRNPTVPAEICTTDRRMCDKRYRFDDDFKPRSIKQEMVKDRDAFAMMLMGIFGHRKLESGAWLTALATKVSQEQLQLRNPLAAVSAVAKAMGHVVTRIDDSGFNQADKIEAQKEAKLITRRHRHIRNAIAARAISLEGAKRVEDCTTSLIYERIRTGIAVAGNAADVSALLQVGINELVERNEALAKKGKQPTSVAGRAEKLRRIENFEYLELGHRLTLFAFQLLQQTGLSTAAVEAAAIKGENATYIKQLAAMFIGDVESGVETLLPVLDRKALKELSRQSTKTDETQMLLERLAVMEEFCLNEELTAPGSELPPYQWMDLTHTQMPQVMRKRFLIEADDSTVEDICRASLFDVPIDTSTGRILETSRLVRAAHYGIHTKVFEQLTSFEATFGTQVVDGDYVSFVRSLMVDSSWLTETDVDSIGTTFRKCARWITANVDRIDKFSKGHVLLFSDSEELSRLAELLSSYRSSLGGLIEAVHGNLKQKGGNANYLRFMRGVLNEASMYELVTLGTVNVGRARKTLVVLCRKPEFPSAAECQRLYQRWLDELQQSLKELKALVTFEEGEALSVRAKALKEAVEGLSISKQRSLKGLTDEQLHHTLVEHPDYKGNRGLMKRRQRIKPLQRFRKLHRRIL